MKTTFYSFKNFFVITLSSLMILGCSTLNSQKQIVPSFDPKMVEDEFSAETGMGAFLAASFARRNMDYGIAAKYYIKALDKEPNNIVFISNAFSLLVYDGQVKQSDIYAKMLLEHIPSHGAAVIAVAVNLAKEGKIEEMRQMLMSVEHHSYNRFLIPLMIAWSYVDEKNLDAAIESLSSLRNVYEYQAIYHFHAGLIKDIFGVDDEAKEHYEITLSGPGGTSLRAVEVMTNFFLRQDDKDKATYILNQYLEQYPDSLMIEKIKESIEKGEAPRKPIYDSKTGMAESIFGVAASLSQGISFDHSLLFIRLSLHLDADFSLATLMLGDILEVNGLHNKANQIYTNIKPDDILWFPTQIRRASNYNYLKETDKAINLLKQLQKEKPDLVSISMELGDTLRVNKNYEESATYYTHAIENIEQFEPRHWSLFYARAISYERAKLWEKAEADFLKALELEPNQPLVLNYLGYSWLERDKNIKEAFNMLKNAYTQRPRDGYIIDSLGWAYYKKGDYKQAAYYLEAAVELEPSNSVINDHLGDVYWKLGRRNEAVFQWKRALSSESDKEEIDPKKIEKKIKNGLH